MIFGVSLLVIITVLLIIDLGLLVFRFRYMESKRESMRLEFQKEMRVHEAEAAEKLKNIKYGREDILASMRRTDELIEQFKNTDVDPAT